MKEQGVLVTNIQRFCLHDGPGIRTTIFFKGCTVHCPWCSNPENIHAYPEHYVRNGLEGTYGSYYSCEELYQEVIKDRVFYADGGGVTYSGGEPLLQIRRWEPLAARLKEEGTHQCAETSLFVKEDEVRTAARYLDLFYVDMKILGPSACGEILGGNMEQYHRNMDALFGTGVPVVVRIPLISGYTDGADNLEQILALLRRYRPLKVELLKGHNLGASKYRSLGREPLQVECVSEKFAETFCRRIEEIGIRAEVCGT